VITPGQCPKCGGNLADPAHAARCDGRQGAVEAAFAAEYPMWARSSDPETSHLAMAEFDREKIKDAVDVCVWVHRRFGPLADFQYYPLFKEYLGRKCCDHLHQQARSIARDRGLIRDTGQKIRCPETGKLQTVWEACAIAAPTIDRCPTCGKVTGRSSVA
jgi:ribosomal protein S27E